MPPQLSFSLHHRPRQWSHYLLLVLACAGVPACGGDPFHDVSVSPAGAYETSLATFADGLVTAWYDMRDGHAEIYARVLDGDGRPSSPEYRLTTGASAAYEADVQAVGTDAFAVGWYEEDAARHLVPRLGVWGRDGRQRWVKTLAENGRNTVVRAGAGAVFAAWIQDEAEGRAAVWGGWWREDGRDLIPPRRLADAGTTTWNLNAALDPNASRGRPRVWLAFDAKAGTRSEELFVADVDDSGQRVTRVSDDDGVASKYPDIAFTSDRVAVTWFDAKDGNEEVYLFVGAPGELTGGLGQRARRVTTTPGRSIGAYVTWNDGRVGLVWCDDSEGQSEIYFQSFDATGGPQQPARRVTQTPESSLIPAIKPWRSGFALAWNESARLEGDDHGDGNRHSKVAYTWVP